VWEKLWQPRLKEWNVIRSPAIDEWKAEGVAKVLVTVLAARFGSLPEEVRAAILNTTDLDTLEGWAPLVGSSENLEQFRKEAKLRRLEEWNVIKSPAIERWKDEGRLEAAAKMLEAVLKRKFGSLSEELSTKINSTTDLTLLERWLLEAGCATTFDQFLKDANL
jgi:hypothetical protein